MGCGSCSSGGCGSGVPAGCGSNGSCGTGGCGKLNVFDWLAGMELPNGQKTFDIVEIRFKNTRKDFYKIPDNLEINTGDVVKVEAASGYDIGIVTLTGELVRMQMRKRRIKSDSKDVRYILRKPSQEEIDKWQEARGLEKSTMLKTRLIVQELKLQMKISDVEYQADRSKATFYYTADDRVDFRELIKILADQFKIRVEMRQIGARQEAGRVGGIGSCGRELCCSSWLTDFRSVSTSAARYQQLAINPIKLAGQCGKLKCCLNYELDAYVDALKEFPDFNLKLKTKKGDAVHQKTDIFKRKLWYIFLDEPSKFYELSLDRVNEILEMNAKGKYPQDLDDFIEIPELDNAEPDYENVVGQDSLTRFDNTKKRKKRKPSRNRKPKGQQNPKAKSNNTSNNQGANKPKPTPKNKGQQKGGPRKSNKNRPPRKKQDNNNKGSNNPQ
ncbi:MAG: hypothetical protein CL843_17160 [Crocinitomicaceae bacterium]|nr:hypothetical protein [Crocinitomicaceae bacterium]|tara:strand:+ start:11721 stop:13046 length:1326 start_codon:yes stop_codon:yes gene_type:complete